MGKPGTGEDFAGACGRTEGSSCPVSPGHPPSSLLLTQPAASWCHPLRRHPKSGDTPGARPSSLPRQTRNPIAAPGVPPGSPAPGYSFSRRETFGPCKAWGESGLASCPLAARLAGLGLGDFWGGRMRAGGSASGGSTLWCHLLVTGSLVSSQQRGYCSLRPPPACPQSISTSIPTLTPHRCRRSSVEEPPARRLPASSQLNRFLGWLQPCSSFVAATAGVSLPSPSTCSLV